MNDDEVLTPRPDPGEPADPRGGPQEQISVLMELIGGLAGKVTALGRRLHALETSDTEQEEDGPSDQPAPWVVFTPPAAAEQRQHAFEGHTPEWTVDNWVVWFNTTYVGLPGSPTVPIPECWRDHPGLAMEVSTLAYSWRRANLGPTANVRDAQYWHHTWRPGFTARLANWVHPHCTDGRHRPIGAPARPTRFAPATTSQDETPETQPGKEESS
ncbi:hypothetical protein [Saccharopolyspora endophytica]|uniref:DUF4913 domain-containing protein n=1 Tax=Saccharopolyspora endophytica TaxID=543886 RepID=A0ABS5DR83_9PSEU|nr:hypothetical protein [Saccharopolyspora endophytica]MBQ0928821.1 hypothetical protein [Saccharopolyspora endophytica]